MGAEGKTESAVALRNLAANNADNKARIAREGGIEPLIALLRDGSAEGKTESAVALRNLALNTDNKRNMLRDKRIIQTAYDEETDTAAKRKIQELLNEIRE